MIIKNLVLSGGNFKGISYIGVFKAIEELNISDNLVNILGVSSGALFSLPFILGLNSTQIEHILTSVSLEQLYNINIDSILDINTNYGIDNGDKITNLLKIIVKKILDNENATFQDLKKFQPNINFIVGAANICTKKYEYFSFKTTPDMPLHIAVRISISIPIYFKSICYNNCYYMDGAFINNYPIDYFSDDIDNTLGIIFKNTEKTNTINNFGVYVYKVATCVMSVMQNYFKEIYLNNTFELVIDYDISELKFDTDTKKILISLGYNEFINKYKIKYGDTATESIQNRESVDINDMIKSLKDEINSNDSS